MTKSFYPRRSLEWIKEMEVVWIENIGDVCCWHIRHYNETLETPMHYEHIGIGFNFTYAEKDHLQNQQTELEKDPGIL